TRTNLGRGVKLRLAGADGGGDRDFGGFAVEHAVHGGVAQNDLDVLAGFGEGNGFDEFGKLLVGAFRPPLGKTLVPGVVGCSGVFRRAGGAHQIGDIKHAQFDVHVGIEERSFVVTDFAL